MVSRVVPLKSPHTVYRGDPMERQKYDATYHLGNTVVHIIGPGDLTPDEYERRRQEVRKAFLKAWQTLSPAQQKELNEAASKDGS